MRRLARRLFAICLAVSFLLLLPPCRTMSASGHARDDGGFAVSFVPRHVQGHELWVIGCFCVGDWSTVHVVLQTLRERSEFDDDLKRGMNNLPDRWTFNFQELSFETLPHATDLQWSTEFQSEIFSFMRRVHTTGDNDDYHRFSEIQMYAPTWFVVLMLSDMLT